MDTGTKSPEEVIAACEAALAATDTKRNPGQRSIHDAYLLARERRALRERIAVAMLDAEIRNALTRPTPTPLARS
jgi:hypothetical protein